VKLTRVLARLGRLVVAGFILLSSLYALLAYIPFTYQQVHKGGLLPILNTFGRIHAQLYWVALAIACAILLPEFRRPKTRWLTISFAVVHVAAGVMLMLFPVMARLRNDASSMIWAEVALAPLVWIAVIDVVGSWPGIEWAEYCKEDDRRIFRAAWHSAVFLSLVYCAIFSFRASVTWGVAERLTTLGATVLCHALIFGVLFAALNLVRSIASLTRWPSQMEFVLSNSLTGAIFFTIVKVLVFHPLSFEGGLATGYAALLAVGLSGSLAGVSVRFWQPADGPVDGLTLAMSPVTIPRPSNRLLQLAPLALLAVLAGVVAVNLAIMDWNYMFQKLGACTIWALSFAYLYAVAPRLRGVPDKRFAILFWAAMLIPCYRLTAAKVATYPKLGTALETYANYDASFRLIRDGISAPPTDDTFYKLLALNTNIPRSVATAPVDIDPAGKLTAGTGPKPNIFFLVIDSLRRDYLGAYNRANTFTPNIDAFARESVVFRNSFTRYGGTGLAEPSLWVGGMMLHKQYVTPFYPMNALAKLIAAENYQSYISMDPILRVIVKPQPDMVELDADKSNMDYRMCSSLDDLESKLDHRPPGRPVFAYTQSQDIHISVINREKNSVVDDQPYPGFYAPYASRLRRVDACFGHFEKFLKDRGLFDDSVIVLTADHGDSLGEDGRWGHAYTLVPEVARVPLIVHLPKAFQNLYSAPNSVAFQSDVTPSLYYMLGHKPTLREHFYGRPLFTESPAEQKTMMQDSYILAASYAAVWGVLGDNGQSLYVADAVNYKDSIFSISENGASSAGYLGSSQKSAAEDLIGKGIAEINAFYKFTPH
jgi:hypothetical protein